MNEREREMERAEERLVDAGLAWRLGGRGPRRPGGGDEEGALRWRGARSVWAFAGLAAGIAVAVALAGLWSDRAEEREAADERAGAASPRPGFQEESHGDESLEDVTSALLESPADLSALAEDHLDVEVRGAWFDDAALASLVSRCPSMQRLRVLDGSLTGAGLVALADLRALETLGLPHCARLRDDAIDRIAALEGLRSLDLSGFVGQVASFGDEEFSDPFSKFSAAGLRRLGSMSGLRTLILDGTAADDDTLRALAAGGAGLRVLGLEHTSVGAAGLAALATIETLEEVSFGGSSDVARPALEALLAIPNLKRLRFGGSGMVGCDLDDSGLALLASRPDLEDLALHDISMVSGAGWSVLGSLRGLRRLDLDRCAKLGETGLAALGELDRLVDLDLSMTAMPSDGFERLVLPAGLRTLNLPSGFARGRESGLRRLHEERGGDLRILLDGRGPWTPRFARFVFLGADGAEAPRTGLIAILDDRGRVRGLVHRDSDRIRTGSPEERVFPGVAEGRVPEQAVFEDSSPLPPGRYEAIALAEGSAEFRTSFEIVADRTTTVLLELRPTGPSERARLGTASGRRFEFTGPGAPVEDDSFVVCIEGETGGVAEILTPRPRPGQAGPGGAPERWRAARALPKVGLEVLVLRPGREPARAAVPLLSDDSGPARIEL